MSKVLFDAVSLGDLDQVRKSLDEGCDVAWVQKKTGRTTLIEAVIHGHLEIVKLLVRSGADLDSQDTAVGMTAVGWSIAVSSDILEYLLASGANPNLASLEFCRSPLIDAVSCGNLKAVQLLIKYGADVHHKKHDGVNALQLAALKNQTEIYQALLDRGATLLSPEPPPIKIPWPTDCLNDECDFLRPECVLRSFILAMFEFESKAPRAKSKQELLELMQPPFERFCTQRERPYGRDGSYRYPVEYDPNEQYLIEIVEVSSHRRELITRNDREQLEFLYVLLKKGGRWLIDGKRYRYHGTKWELCHL